MVTIKDRALKIVNAYCACTKPRFFDIKTGLCSICNKIIIELNYSIFSEDSKKLESETNAEKETKCGVSDGEVLFLREGGNGNGQA